MKKHIVHALFPVMALLTIGLLFGCAGGDGDRDSSRQGPPSMSMGHGGRGGKQGPPPMSEKTGATDEEPPAEAIAACVEQEVGDSVEFTNPQGEAIKAVCQEYEDHLVAVPQKR